MALKVRMRTHCPHTLLDVVHHRAPPNKTVHLATNLNKSDKAHYDLINTPLHKNWDILALQEPYINMLGNTKVN